MTMPVEHTPQPRWTAFVGWIAGGALALAFVVYPFVILVCAIMRPDLKIPALSLTSMWPPVLAILGVPALGMGQRFISLRENRKSRELDMNKCGNCPAKNCDECPVRKTVPDCSGTVPRVVGAEGV
jgi:hypothetical protein